MPKIGFTWHKFEFEGEKKMKKHPLRFLDLVSLSEDGFLRNSALQIISDNQNMIGWIINNLVKEITERTKRICEYS